MKELKIEVKIEESFVEMFQKGIEERTPELEEPIPLTTVVISSKRAGYSMQALARIIELAKDSERILAFTKLYDDVYLDRFGKLPELISPNKNSGRFHQFVLKSNYTLEELDVILDPLNFPDYTNYCELDIVDIGL